MAEDYPFGPECGDSCMEIRDEGAVIHVLGDSVIHARYAVSGELQVTGLIGTWKMLDTTPTTQARLMNGQNSDCTVTASGPTGLESPRVNGRTAALGHRAT